MKKFRKQTAGKIAVILALAVILGGCGSAAPEGAAAEEESAVTVSTQSVETGTITLTNSFIGTISPEETVMVIPLAQGVVTETFFEVGDTVQAGDVLFKIDDEAAKLALEQAQLSVESTKNQMDSTMNSLINQQDSSDLQIESSKLQSQSQFEQAQIAYVMAKNAYEEADKLYNNMKKSAEANKQAEAAQKQKEAAQQSVSDNDLEPQNGISTQDYGNGASGGYTLADLEKARDSAYQAYLQARSAYHAAERGRELTEETKEMTDDQLATTIEDTEASLKTGLSLAALGVEQAQMALSYYTVTAPVSGVIESKNVDVNGMATQASPAYTIVNNNTMTVTFQVSEAVRNTLSIGQELTLERNDDTYTAAITEIGSSINLQSGLFQIKACVQADGTRLPSGVSVKVNADTYRAENTLIIPYDAVYYENEGAYVYTSVNGRAVKTPITTGIFDDENIVVTGGLNQGDIVVTSWSPQLTGGVLLHAVGEDTPANAGNNEAE